MGCPFMNDNNEKKRKKNVQFLDTYVVRFPKAPDSTRPSNQQAIKRKVLVNPEASGRVTEQA